MPNRLNVRRMGIPTYEQQKKNHHNPITTFILRYMRKIPLVYTLTRQERRLVYIIRYDQKKATGEKKINRKTMLEMNIGKTMKVYQTNIGTSNQYQI